MMNIFIRFGNLPPRNKSRNAITGKIEKGISVFPAIYEGGYVYYKSPIETERINDLWAGKYNFIIYMVIGDIIGYGSDNEPLIANIKEMRRLKYSHSTKSYKIQ